MTWEMLLVASLSFNAALGFGYRVYRLSRGGPLFDAIGQALLGLVLMLLAVGVSLEAGWPRWVALAYGLMYGLVVMPLWVLAVLIPMRPGPIDYGFAVVYWVALALIVVAAVAL